MENYTEYANMVIVEHYYTHSLFDTVVFASESLEDAFEYLYQQNLEDDYSVLEIDNFGNATYPILWEGETNNVYKQKELSKVIKRNWFKTYSNR